jgi:hypothetical protein
MGLRLSQPDEHVKLPCDVLTKLTIRNFKRFAAAEIELGNPVVFIAPTTPARPRRCRRSRCGKRGCGAAPSIGKT